MKEIEGGLVIELREMGEKRGVEGGFRRGLVIRGSGKR